MVMFSCEGFVLLSVDAERMFVTWLKSSDQGNIKGREE